MTSVLPVPVGNTTKRGRGLLERPMCSERMEGADLWQAQTGSDHIARGVAHFPVQTYLAPRRVDRARFTNLMLGPVRMLQIFPAIADAKDTVLAFDVVRMHMPARIEIHGRHSAARRDQYRFPVRQDQAKGPNHTRRCFDNVGGTGMPA